MTKVRSQTMTDKTFVKLPYADFFTINCGLATTEQYTYRMNSIYDPDYTSTGHQPMGFDQWKAFYEKYIVLGFKITLWVQSLGQVYGTVSLHPDNDPAFIGNQMEQPNASWKIITSPTQGQDSGKQVVKMKRYVGLKKFYSRAFDYDNDAANTNSGPLTPAYMNIQITNLNTTSDYCRVYVKLKYYVKFFSRIDLPQS